MATGLTHDIHDGKPVSFERFVWLCARMMTPLILMRDDPIEVLPPDEFKPLTNHCEKQIDEMRAMIAKLEAMTDEDAIETARDEYKESVERAKDWNKKAVEIKARYEAMLRQVDTWNPPTADHAHLKEFMREQLLDSIRHDCSYQHEIPRPPKFADWKQDRLSLLRDELKREEGFLAEEIQRTTWRNVWLKTLRESVPYPSAPTEPAA